MKSLRRTHLIVTLFAVCSLAVSFAWMPPTLTLSSSQRTVEPNTRNVFQHDANQNPISKPSFQQESLMTTSFLHFQAPPFAMALVCGWTLFAGPVLAASDDIVAKGNVIFDNNCAACHAGGQNLINTPRTLKQEAIVKNLGSLDPTTVKDFVQNSVVHRGAFILGSKLSSKDFDNVVSYVVDQASHDKWLME
eukprot:CAMPEP_0202483882 /NCGR_PEP_ID=MMETSP1361-20130828/3049_1 /ASSEMBLY_ACC=CAM_ASM_000849 /TAXON_ID=210615 /ORGANISM="Staurosira complex sp., Strain CCMP2646" /LENGTH=191 /DNA_ID=CAMNT_0049112311 /DNA_START=63 /DNA_END=638 /DNA_ORIENTATION=-